MENLKNKTKKFRWGIELILMTVFQVSSFTQVLLSAKENTGKIFLSFACFILLEWAYVFILRISVKQTSFELEIISFFLSGIGLSLIATIDKDYAFKQMIYIYVGVIVFLIMRWLIGNADRVTVLRLPAAAFAGAALAFNLIFSEEYNGAKNWVNIGGISFQPSEIVKIAFIFVGAATLDKLQTTKSVFKYLVFAAGCIGALFLMRDFGTALIFFATFLIIAYMRSGDIRTIAIICVVAVLGAIMIVTFKSTVAERFSTYRHIWDSPYGKGMQQTRMLTYSAGGGLFGLGVGKGMLRNIYAASTDLIFGMVCEEYGLLIGLEIVLVFPAVLIYTIASSKSARSSFYVIAACSSAGLLLVQVSLNVFGVTDLIPWTGVTFPFVSRGGSSMICCWALMAFIKSVDPRAYPRTLKETETLI